LSAAYVKKAAALNEAGIKPARPVMRSAPKPPAKAPADLVAALKKNKKAQATFDAFSPSAKREYVEWVTGAKSDETRARRIKTAVGWMAEGKHRNCKYMSVRLKPDATYVWYEAYSRRTWRPPLGGPPGYS
jgi:uncharacterized protein YdeI (YjbR/CyaY-like superfamily)